MQPTKSCIDALPVELLSFIFVLATHSYTNPQNTVPFTSESVKIPLTLSAVNRYWRFVALDTSALWTSLCATVGSIGTNSLFDTSLLVLYISRSRRAPLDVLIDARDQEWDFSEPEIPSAYEYSTYAPPFSKAHMDTVVSLLLPHIFRWRSFVVLTDTWAPMHTALCLLNSTLVSSGAPRLESLILMRCNEYVSHSPEFQPPNLKSPAFLEFKRNLAANPFPRLRQLVLRGVHVDWGCLQKSSSSLQSLEISSHSPDVRPRLHDFHNILSTATKLRKLTLHGSGPLMPEDSRRIPDTYLRSLCLQSLEELVLGYRSIVDSISLLEMLDMPNLKCLTLEDATHPGDIDDLDATPLLIYLAQGARPLVQSIVIRGVVNGQVQPVSRPRETKVSSEDVKPPLLPPRKPLERVEALTLKRVKAHPQDFQCFFQHLTSLKHLELYSTNLDPLDALFPGRTHIPFPLLESVRMVCPCPQLTSLTIRNLDSDRYPNMRSKDFDEMLTQLNISRAKIGAGEVQVDFYVSSARVREWAMQGLNLAGVSKAYPVIHGEYEEDVYDHDPYESDLYEEDAFQLGGAFNDPLFDAYYGGRISFAS